MVVALGVQEEFLQLCPVHQPVRQREVRYIEHARAGEGGAVFGVDIEDHDMGVALSGLHADRRLKDLGYRVGFAGARRADYGDMLVEKAVPFDRDGDRLIRRQMGKTELHVGRYGFLKYTADLLIHGRLHEPRRDRYGGAAPFEHAVAYRAERPPVQPVSGQDDPFAVRLAGQDGEAFDHRDQDRARRIHDTQIRPDAQRLSSVPERLKIIYRHCDPVREYGVYDRDLLFLVLRLYGCAIRRFHEVFSLYSLYICGSLSA